VRSNWPRGRDAVAAMGSGRSTTPLQRERPTHVAPGSLRPGDSSRSISPGFGDNVGYPSRFLKGRRTARGVTEGGSPPCVRPFSDHENSSGGPPAQSIVAPEQDPPVRSGGQTAIRAETVPCAVLENTQSYTICVTCQAQNVGSFSNRLPKRIGYRPATLSAGSGNAYAGTS
jgi:hypothetical protein